MGNQYQEKVLRTIFTTQSLNQSYRGAASLPRNLNKNKICNYNNTDNNVSAPQPKKSCTLPKSLSKGRKLLQDQDKEDTQDNSNSVVLVLREGQTGSNLIFPEDSKNGGHLATWGGKYFNKDEVDQLKAYISYNNITTLCITFLRLIDYKNGLKPLFEGVVSQSPTIDMLCININSIAENELTLGYVKKLLSCAIKTLHKSGGRYSKNIYIGSDNNKSIDQSTLDNIFKAMCTVNKKTKLESETHCLKFSIAASEDLKKTCNEYEKKYSQKTTLKVVNYDRSNNASLKNIIEFSQVTYPSKPSTFKKFCNMITHNINSNKSACEEEDTNVNISTTDNQDSLYNNVALGNTNLLVDDAHVYYPLI